MRLENIQAMRLSNITGSVELTREEELRLQEEFIAKRGVKRVPPVENDQDFERLHRIEDFKRELKERYSRPENMN